jgi:hypothetical protein
MPSWDHSPVVAMTTRSTRRQWSDSVEREEPVQALEPL